MSAYTEDQLVEQPAMAIQLMKSSFSRLLESADMGETDPVFTLQDSAFPCIWIP